MLIKKQRKNGFDNMTSTKRGNAMNRIREGTGYLPALKLHIFIHTAALKGTADFSNYTLYSIALDEN